MSDKVLVIRTCNADMTSYNGFKWPESGPVECPDWNPKPECGHGLHGLKWGRGNWSLLSNDTVAKWIVVEVDETDCVDIDGGKVKFRRGNVVYCGNMAEAMARVLCDCQNIEKLIAGGATDVASGYSSSAASSGNNTIAMAAGYNCAVKAGNNGCFAAAWWDGNRPRIVVGYVGENGIKTDKWYKLDDAGNWREV